MEKQREEYVSILENKNEEIKILKDKIVFFTKLFKSCMAHKREIKELKETIKDSAFKMNMKEEEIKQLKETCKDKAFKMDLKGYIVRDMQAKLEMKETIVRDLHEKMDKKENMVRDFQEKTDKIENMVRDLQEKLDMKEEIVRDMQEKMDMKEEIVRDMHEKLDRKEEIVRDRQEKLDMKEEMIKDMQEKINHEDIVNNSLAAGNEFLKVDNANLMETLNNQNDKLLKLSNQEALIENKNKKISDLEDELLSVKDALSFTNETLKTETANNENEKQKFAALEVKLKVSEDDHSELIELFKTNEHKVKELLETIKEKSAQYTKLNTLIERLETGNSEMKEKFTFKENKLEEMASLFSLNVNFSFISLFPVSNLSISVLSLVY